MPKNVSTLLSPQHHGRPHCGVPPETVSPRTSRTRHSLCKVWRLFVMCHTAQQGRGSSKLMSILHKHVFRTWVMLFCLPFESPYPHPTPILGLHYLVLCDDITLRSPHAVKHLCLTLFDERWEHSWISEINPLAVPDGWRQGCLGPPDPGKGWCSFFSALPFVLSSPKMA